MTDLTADEQGRVRLALTFLLARVGNRRALAKALGFSPHTLRHVRSREKAVSPRMAIRVARLAGVRVDDVLAGRFPPAGTCPHCGRGVL